MNEPTRNDAQDAATEAAQNAVDETTSWEYSAERGTIQADLEKGLDAAGVDVSDTEKQRLVDEIDDVKGDEHSGGPEVDPAEVSPADGA
ncbi:hypothetical protein [Phycicoccus duodecadis]|uniref:Uncharacterized protein n=1 Tax=Phycicoccus duodecadis TaxID=173053 RepID=A0A2N3YGD1_9MICO|nr:hypothetical protein [Phycicoccus duodecadis]PKW25917.1 hypothetical protein ATL31_0721 [Phycicoccus duodecadis]